MATFGEGERALAGTVPQAVAKWQVRGLHSERQWLVDYQVHMWFYTNVFAFEHLKTNLNSFATWN